MYHEGVFRGSPGSRPVPIRGDGDSYNGITGQNHPYKGSPRQNWSDRSSVNMQQFALDEWAIEAADYTVKIELMYQHYLMDDPIGIVLGGGKPQEMFWIQLAYETFTQEQVDKQAEEKGKYDDEF